MTGTQWLWIVLAVVLFVAAVFFLARFIVGDRARGRQRCPKCWYDMAGSGETCPECGREARSPRELSRTRRQRRWAVLGVVFLLLGGGSLATRQAVTRGAVSLVPDWVLVAGMERWPPGAMYSELKRRHWEGELSEKAQRHLIDKSIALLEPDGEPAVLARAAWAVQVAEFLGEDESERHTKPWANWVLASEVANPRTIVLRLLPLLSHSDPSVRVTSSNALAELEQAYAIALPSVIMHQRELAGEQTPSVGGNAAQIRRRPFYPLQDVIESLVTPSPEKEAALAFVSALRERQFDMVELRASLLEGLRSPEADIRLISLWMLRMGFWPDEEARLLALASYDPEELLTAAAIVDYAVSGPLDEPAAAVIRQAFQTSDYEQWAWAAEQLGKRGEEAAEFIPDMHEMLGTFRARMSALPYAQVSGDRETAARTLLAVAHDKRTTIDGGVLRDFARIGWLGEEVISLWRDQLDSEKPNNRLSAAAALLRSGPPEGFDKAELTQIAADACVEAFGALSGTLFQNAVRYGEADIPTVLEILGDCTDSGAPGTVWSLGMAGSAAEAALPWLREAMKDANPRIADSAALAVRRIEWCLKNGDPPAEERDRW